MLNKIKRAYKIWTLADKDPEYLKAIEGLSKEYIKAIPDKGDGKAVFMPLMSENEKREYLKNQEPVWKKFNEKLKEIIG